MMSWHAAGAALAQQTPELESGEGKKPLERHGMVPGLLVPVDNTNNSVKAPLSSNRAFWERSNSSGRSSEYGQSPLKADSACLVPKQTTHRLCVPPADM